MTRLLFNKEEIQHFIKSARSSINLSREQLASKLNLSGRTLADWQRGKFLPDKNKLEKLSQLSGIPLPIPIETRENWWSGKVNGPAGARARFKIYVCSYTLEQRRKGGHNSQVNRHDNPDHYRQLGCPIPRDFAFPNQHNPRLAEFIGILLGDGCIQPGQVSITLNSVADKKYIDYVSQLITSLFAYSPTIRSRAPVKATTILISGKDFTDKLVKNGMKVGDKVKQQVDVPRWIKKSPELSRWCLRGLMDTDGGIFTHTYAVKGKSYSYLKTNFTNASQPLLNFVYRVFKDNGFHPDNKRFRKVWLYSQDESKRYLKVIGSSNERLLKKIR